jgi:hypothetical protein
MAVDVLEELSGHLDDAADTYRDAGLDPADADRRAIRAMGDPTILGRDLGKARRRGRFLLAAVGGAVRATITFGIWAWLVLGLVWAGLAVVGTILAVIVQHALGLAGSSLFDWRQLGSLGTVALAVAWFAWLGRVLPGRVAKSARRSVPGVRVGTGVIGFVLGSAFLWFLAPFELDAVLALGLPLAPAAFLVAALRAPGDPSIHVWRRRGASAAIAGLAVVVATIAALTSASASQGGGWEADLSVVGGDPAQYPVFTATDYSVNLAPAGFTSFSGGKRNTTAEEAMLTIADETEATALAREFPMIALEIRPARTVGGQLVIGAPIAVATSPTSAQTQIEVAVPVYRTRVDVIAVVVAIASDGTRVNIGMLDGPFSTSTWRGTLADWWLSSR